jgi:molybdopterin converting factor small subunit
VEIALKATSHLAEFIPAGGKLSLNEGSSVGDLLENVGIDSDLVMLIVINGELGDIGSSLGDGMTVELIPPISGG